MVRPLHKPRATPAERREASTPAPSPAARAQRRYRQHQKCGEQVLPVLIGPRVVEAMLASGRLEDVASRNRRKVAAEAAAVLEEWAAIWLAAR